MVKDLAQNGDIHTGWGDRRLLNIAQAKFDIFYLSFFGLIFPEADDFGRAVDGDNLFGALGKEFAHETLAGTQVGDHQRRKHFEKQLTESLPGAARTILEVKASGNLIEKKPGALLAQSEHTFEIGLIA
ncbi:hypothetical protein SDC9_184083 [bioreactor metagenome]|uniref:Uncharacterized protein n=1 Tax=bioreactor metagenome TaxID=1076179 RepID=A0A645HKB5_9ZZZZ